MHIITLDNETDFDGWRKTARTLALNDVKPSDVTWKPSLPSWSSTYGCGCPE